MEEVRVTIAVAEVLRAFLEDVSAPRYGYDLMRQTHFASGKIYPILARLQKAGWLTREYERIDAAAEGRPARAMYQLTGGGAERARYELALLSERFRVPATATRRLSPER